MRSYKPLPSRETSMSKFRHWLEYFGDKYGKVVIAVPPHYTSVKWTIKDFSKLAYECDRNAMRQTVHIDTTENAFLTFLAVSVGTLNLILDKKD